MGTVELIKEGIGRANRNWPLLIVQFVGGVISVFAAFVLIGVPVIIGVIMVGFDVSQMSDVGRIFGDMDFHDIFSRYLSVIIILVIGILLYIVFAVCLSAFVQAGTAASIGRSALKRNYEFNLSVFFKDARRFFRPMLLYNILLFFVMCFLIAIVVLAIVVLAAAGVLALAEGTVAGDGATGVFFHWLITLSAVLFFVVIFASFFGLSMQGMAPLVMRGQGPVKSIQTALRFWDRDRGALWVLAMVLGGVILVEICAGVLGAAIQMIPFIGPIINIPYRFAANVLGLYLWIVALSTVFYYYALKNSRKRPGGPAAERPVSSSGGGSSSQGHISPQEGGGPRPLPPPIPPQG
jgi:hypothetical protein